MERGGHTKLSGLYFRAQEFTNIGQCFLRANQKKCKKSKCLLLSSFLIVMLWKEGEKKIQILLRMEKSAQKRKEERGGEKGAHDITEGRQREKETVC